MKTKTDSPPHGTANAAAVRASAGTGSMTSTMAQAGSMNDGKKGPKMGKSTSEQAHVQAKRGPAAQGIIIPEEVDDEDIDDGKDGLSEGTKKLMLRSLKNTRTVDKEAVVDTILEKKMERDSFCRLPFTIFFFTVYCLAIFNHEDVTNSGMVQREMRSMLEGTTYEGVAYTSGHKDMGDIDTKEDIYNYLREAVLPLFINPLRGTHSTDLHRALRYNMVIGGVTVHQIRRKTVNCGEEYPNFGPYEDTGDINPIMTNFSCYPWSGEDRTCFGPESKQWVDNKPRAGWCPDELVYKSVGRRLDYIPEGGGTGGSSKGAVDPRRESLFSVNIYNHEGIDEAVRKVSALEADGWIDLNTAWVGVQLLVLNPDLAIFVHITVNIYMPPSGGMHPKVEAQSFQPEPYQKKEVAFIDILYAMGVMWLSFDAGKTFMTHLARGKVHHYFLNLWHFLDLLCVLYSYAIFIMWFLLLDKLGAVKDACVMVHNADPHAGLAGDADFPSLVAGLHEELNAASVYLMNWRLCLSWYTIVVALKFLESFANQPRLAVVTKTITEAGPDLFHFGIVMTSVFLAYAVAGTLLFGRRIYDFASVPQAISTCFLIMIGDFDWEELGEENPATAQLWFWTFMAIMTMIMLNMLMAIIMDVYSGVKSDAEEMRPVWVQLYVSIADICNTYRGHLIANGEMLQVLNDMPEDQVDANILMRRAGPGLSKYQADLLIENTKVAMDSQLHKGVSMSDAMAMIGWVKKDVQKIGWKLEEMLTPPEEVQKEPASGPGVPKAGAISGDAPSTGKDFNSFVIGSEARIEGMENRIAKIDTFMQESLHYSTYRGRDLADRLAKIEDTIRRQRDIIVRDTPDIWEMQSAKLGSVAPQTPDYEIV